MLPSPVKAPQKKVVVQSRTMKTKVSKMSESESSNSTHDEETRATLGAELAFGVFLMSKTRFKER